MDISKSILNRFLTSIVFMATFGFATVTVDGYAYLENQTDHNGVTITFERTVPSALTETTTTDASGYFTAQLETGVYDVTYTKDDYFSEFLYDQSCFSNLTLPDQTLLNHESLINVPSMFLTIQEAINRAYDGDTVLVQPGTYNDNINFLGKEIVVTSQFLYTLDTSYISSTIIDGGGNASVVTFASNETLNSKLIGFTLTNGYADYGGGIHCNASPTLSNLTVISNKAWSGGGGIYFDNSSSIVNEVLIKNNELINSYPSYWMGGGGINIRESDDIVLDNIVIDGNSLAAGKGGGIMFGYGSSPTIQNIIIKNNTAGSGGGVHANGDDVPGPNPTLIEATITGNSATNGGGVYAHEGNITLKNSNIFGNNATNNGGGIYLASQVYSLIENTLIHQNNSNNEGGGIWQSYAATLNVINSTIDANGSSNGGGIFCDQTGVPYLKNTNVSNNTNYGLYLDSNNPPTVEYCNFFNNQGNFYNTGEWVGINLLKNSNGDSCDIYYNIQEDPLFADTENGDYNLQQNSPCIDAGDPTSPYDADGSIADMGALPSAYGTPVPIVINVPTDYSTIQAALSAANETDTVLVQPGTYTENIFWPETNGIKLISAGDSSNTIIDGGGVSVVIYSNTQNLIDIHIDGFKIINGANFASNATGIWSKNSKIKMFNSSIRNCENGGLYSEYSGKLLIENSTISSNTKFGLSCQDLESLDISNSVIKNNLGPGIHISRLDTVNIARSEISNNIVDYNTSEDAYESQGGGITILNTESFSIENTILSNNSGPWAGGLWLSQTNYQIDECIFENNTGTWPSGSAANAGGASLEPGNDSGTSLITNTTFTNNYSTGKGGGLNASAAFGASVIINKSNFINNDAERDGGGCILGYNVTIKNSLVLSNTADEGGGIYSNGAIIDSVEIVNNHASSKGGGIFVDDRNISTTYISLLSNHSTYGGGVYGSDAEFTMMNGTVLLNDAEYGDGFYIESENLTVNNSNIINNQFAVLNNSSNMLDFISNYWGNTSGPYHPTQNPSGQGDSVNTFVNVDPWLTVPDTDAPPSPAQNTTVTGTGNDFISLDWDASPLGDLAGYKLYYDSDSSGYPYANSVDIGTDTSYTLSSLTLGTTYYLAVTTYDTDGNESWYSNEVSGVTRVMQAQSLDIGGDEDLQHMVSHTPSITFGYYDSMNETQTSYQVQVSTQSDYSSIDMWDSGEISSSDTSVTYDGVTLEDGATYYLRVKVGSGAFYSDWSTLIFRMNTEPTTPVLVSPINDQVTATPVVLNVLNGSDAEGDAVTYSFNVYDDATLTTKLDSATTVTEGTDTTSWQVTATLPDNGQYFWTVSTNDGYEESAVSDAVSFLLNIANDAPAAFALLSPADSAEVTALTPLLDWASASDPDPIDTVRYTLYFDTPEPGVTIVSVDTATSYQVATSLSDNTTYYWKVVATDLSGATTENTGGYHSFRVNTENDLPSDFALLSPEDNSMVTDLTPTFHWDEPTDADDGRSTSVTNDLLSHVRSNTRTNSRSITSYNVFISIDSMFSGVIPDTVLTNSYTPASYLNEDIVYYWKVVAVDDDGGTKESAVWSFWTNNTNSSPDAFTLLSPENSEVLTIFNPSLTWSSTTDADLNDELSYSVELGIHIDSLSVVYTGTDTTFSTSALSENTTYYWQVTATDLSGATTENTGGYHSFRINTENDLPGNFALLSPDSGSMVTDLTPTLHWEVPTDADDRRNRSIVSYYVYLDTSLTGTVPDTVSTNSYTASTLLEDALYYWKVVAVDNDGGTKESSTWSFWTNSENSVPSPFTLLTPTVGEETGLTPTFSWTASSDADLYDVIGYTVSYGSDPTSLTDVSTNSELTYTLETDLTDNTDYVWQVTATDQSGATYTTALQSFTVNNANDNPGIFSLISPDSGSVVLELPPLLVWSPTTDLDGDSVLFDVQLNGTSIGMTHHNYFFVDDLAEDMTYTWSVTATDNNGGSTQSGTWSFIVNTENVPPTPFALLSPETETVFNTQSVFFEWETSTDPDPMDSVTYGLDVHTDTTHMHFEINTTSFTSEAFMDNRVYHWSVTAHDMNGGVTENIGGPRMFVINVENDPPTASTLVAPLDESIQTGLTPNFYWTEADDPDPMDHISYTMNWWPMGLLPVIYSADTDSNSLTPEENLTDNSQFGWMVTANDMHGAQSSSDSSYFYTDAFPEPPLNFATVAPENNAEGIATEVEFAWNETDDPDPVEEIHYQLVYATDWADSSTYVFSELIQDTSLTVSLEDNSQYYWIVVAMDTDGFMVGSNDNIPNTMVVGTLSIDGADIPEVFALHQNYPNPFNPTTQIRYDLPEDAMVSITIYDLMGRSIKSLVNSNQSAGYRSVQWNATNNLGEPVSAGMYIYMIQAGKFSQTKKMVLLK